MNKFSPQLLDDLDGVEAGHVRHVSEGEADVEVGVAEGEPVVGASEESQLGLGPELLDIS